jgi:hypothetical protein
MVTRRSLAVLAVATLVLFAVAGVIGNHRHGAVGTVGDVAWFGFLLSLVLLVVASAAVLMRRPKRPSRE